MASEKKKRVYIEDTKARHTTHWDWDYLSREELEALYRSNRIEKGLHKEEPKGFGRKMLLLAGLAGSIATMLAVLFLLLMQS